MKLQNLKNKISRPPVYGKKTLRIAFEFGMVLSETAKKLKIKMTAEKVATAEEILIRELKENGLEKTALNMLPLILAILEPK